MKMFPAARLAVVCLCIVLGGCTTTPQILPVIPQPEVSANAARGAGRSIAIEMVDARGTDVVGLRNANESASAITTAPEMLRNMQSALESGYRKQGFTVIPIGDEADVALEVRLTKLGYERDAAGVLPDLRTGATFEVTSVMPTRTVNGVYSDGQAKDTLLKPSLSANAELLNQHIDAALAKLIADTRLTAP